MRRRIALFVFFLFILVLDLGTKHLAEAHLVYGESVPVISGLFDFTLVYNKGAAFGMFSGLEDGVRRLALGSVSVVAIVVILFMFREARGDLKLQLALSGILAGAVGNIVDRVRYDAVVDFLDFYIGSYHWPAFNIADSAIVVGVGMLIYRMIFPLPDEDVGKEGYSETNSA
jgi:signal peptidase II